MTKRVARACVAAGCRASMLLTMCERRLRGRLTILCYHRVLPADRQAAYFLNDLVVTPESFRRHCLTLRRHYDVLPLYEAVQALGRKQAGRRPLAAVTFDDGYRDNLRYAASTLEEIGLRATFFIIADLAGAEEQPWYDRMGRAVDALARSGRARQALADHMLREAMGGEGFDYQNGTLPRQVVAAAKKMESPQRLALTQSLCAAAGDDIAPPPDDLIMNWRDLAELADSGHEIGSHGARHEILPQLDDASLEAEIAGSRRTLQRGLDRPVRSFCYPNGDCDERVARAVAAAGYECAVTVEPGHNGPEQDAFRLRRCFIHEDRLTGLRGRSSDALLRMELSSLAATVFRRRRGRTDPAQGRRP